MPKYEFEYDEITRCKDCPLLLDFANKRNWEAIYCGLEGNTHIGDKWHEIQKWCPLKRVK